MISKDTAYKAWCAYREIEVAEGLLAHLEEAAKGREVPDLRDSFGRRVHGLQLGVPSGDSGHRLYDVSPALAVAVLRAHVAEQQAVLAAIDAQISAGAKVGPEPEKEAA